MLDDSVYTSVSEIGDAENISKSYISRILRLTLLAPDIVEGILDGRRTAGLAALLKPFPLSGSGSANSSYVPDVRPPSHSNESDEDPTAEGMQVTESSQYNAFIAT